MPPSKASTSCDEITTTPVAVKPMAPMIDATRDIRRRVLRRARNRFHVNWAFGSEVADVRDAAASTTGAVELKRFWKYIRGAIAGFDVVVVRLES